jgi:hypothetical protein
VRFVGGAEQTFKAERVMTSGEGADQRVVLFPTQVNELASTVEAVFLLVHDRSGKEIRQPCWPVKGEVPEPG